jgi:hypothetical protein
LVERTGGAAATLTVQVSNPNGTTNIILT